VGRITISIRIVLCVLCLPLFVAPALAQGAGPYEIGWYTIDGGIIGEDH